MKLRRSDRMVVISNYLINNPYKLTSLNTFAEKYESAKSSISEDIVIIKRAFEEIEIGHIQTVTGAGGGVIFTPSISSHDAKEMVEDLHAKLSESDRILPGGYWSVRSGEREYYPVHRAVHHHLHCARRVLLAA